jgi:WS/DGAT/MGAT family acyltransferase
MHQLNGVDAFHVLEERPRQHMHTIKVAVLDPSTSSEPFTPDKVRAWVRDRLVHMPPLRWRLVSLPVRIGRPVWIDGGPLDLDYHVRTATLPAPGGDGELDALVSQILSEQLDRRWPLWQVTYVDGLADGRVALVFKIHHSIMDGQASVRFFEMAFDSDEDFPFPIEPVIPERTPTIRELYRYVFRQQGKQWVAIPSVFRRSLASIRDNRALKKSGAPPVVNPMSGPRTRFNDVLTPERAYVDVTVPLADIRAIKDALGCSLNDVYVTLCGGAIRRYLAEHGELHQSKSLISAMPVSLRADHDRDSFGNRTTYWYISVGTDQADQIARLRKVQQSIAAAREWAKGDVELFAVWMDYYLLFGTMTLGSLGLVEAAARRPLFNVIVSNVRGPRPLSLYGAEVVAVRSAGPITGRLGLNLTGWSYGEQFSIGLHACVKAAPDLRRLADHVRDELAEFRRVAEAARVTPQTEPTGSAPAALA